MKKSLTQNTFELLIMDLHPLETPNTVYTNALNATIITRDGNEGVLLNDMGNGRVETAYLPEGYIPLGTCSLGGIIYVACYNPLTDKGQIGCFPSPERNVSSDEVTDLDVTLSNNDFKWIPDKDENGVDLNYSTTGAEVYYLKKGLFQEEFTFNPGDKFIVYGNPLSYNFLKLWIEEEYDDFFGNNTEPLWEDEDESELEELVDYNKGDLQKDKMEYYSKPIITIEYGIVNNLGGDISPLTCTATQKHITTDGSEEYIPYDLKSDQEAFSFSIENCADGISIGGTGKIDGIGVSVSHALEVVGTVIVTVTMNDMTNSAQVDVLQDAMDVKSISLISIEGIIGYSRTDGDVGAKNIEMDIIDGKIQEELYIADTIDNKLDFSNVLVNISANYDDGTEPYITTCAIESIDIEQPVSIISELFTTILTNGQVVTINKFDYSVINGNNFYDMLEYMINNYPLVYSWIDNIYEDLELDDDLTEEAGSNIYDFCYSTALISLCTLKINCVFGNIRESFYIKVNVIPQYLSHICTNSRSSVYYKVYIPSQTEENATHITTNVTNLSLGNYKNGALDFDIFIIKNFPRIYSGYIIDSYLPNDIQYYSLELDQVSSTGSIFTIETGSDGCLEWNADNAMTCTDTDGDGEDDDCVINDDLNDVITLSQNDKNGNSLEKIFVFEFVDDNPNAHN